MIIKKLKQEFEHTILYNNIILYYGSGGLHACIEPGTYESTDEDIIIDCDVSSLYPSIAVINNMYPEHLGIEFCKVYEGILNDRLIAKKAGNIVLSDGYKLSLNSVYGKSNDEYSFLMDPLYTVKTTINGQLLISMLIEQLCVIPNLIILQVNTDGITVKINKKYIELYYDICKSWEQQTRLQLEYVNYSKMVIRDVNNYLSVTDKGKIKYKGCFEIDKDYHKDNSFKIIPYALSKYFVDKIPIKDTIYNHTNIYDFCGKHKTNKDCYSEIRYWQLNSIHKNAELVSQKQQKTTRYYISNNGNPFYRVYNSGISIDTEEAINKGFKVTIFNEYVEKEINDYKIDYSFYTRECSKIIEIIENRQYCLF